MTSFESEFRKGQSLLGTFFQISIAHSGVGVDRATFDQAVFAAFAEAHRLQGILSVFNPDSEVNRLNSTVPNEPIEVSREFYYLLQLAEAIWLKTEGGFDLFFPCAGDFKAKVFEFAQQDECYMLCKRVAAPIDLGGIPQGYIIDRTVRHLMETLPHASGVVNMGGDLRFFNTNKRCLNLRLGSTQDPLARSLLASSDSIATSRSSVTEADSLSTTRYPRLRRASLTSDHAVVVMASCCSIAGCLAKVALFATRDVIESCAKNFGAKVLIFDPRGRLAEEYGAA